MSVLRAITTASKMIHQALSRVTSGGKFIPAVDGLRCVAILAVVLYHLEDYVVHKHPRWRPADYATTWLHSVLHAGGCGVPLFFAISGFILGLPFIEARLGRRPKVTLTRYYWRRITRLEPPYLINLTIMTVLLMLVKDASLDDLLSHWFASAAYIHGLVYSTMSTINFVTWSLEVEVQFYLIAPLLTTMLYAPALWLRRGLLIGAIGVCMAAKIINGGPVITSWPFALPNFLDHFLVGLLLAEIYAGDWNSAPTPHWAGDLLAFCGWSGVLVSQMTAGISHCLPVFTFLAFAGSLRGRVFHRLLTVPAIVVTGGMCYTIYLYHFALISAVGRLLLGMWPDAGYLPIVALNIVVLVPCILAASAGLFWLFEKPFMAWRGVGWPRWQWPVVSTSTSVTQS